MAAGAGCSTSPCKSARPELCKTQPLIGASSQKRRNTFRGCSGVPQSFGKARQDEMVHVHRAAVHSSCAHLALRCTKYPDTAGGIQGILCTSVNHMGRYKHNLNSFEYVDLIPNGVWLPFLPLLSEARIYRETLKSGYDTCTKYILYVRNTSYTTYVPNVHVIQ